MNKTTFTQKLLLVVFGIFLTLIFLEIGLRMAGGVVLYLQERHNHVSFNSNEYRILCLGESTTALGGEDSYPSQLEEMLNAQSRQIKFTVINKGIISTTSNYILAHIDQNLDTYKPRMVIVMMGINDKTYMHSYKVLWWENIKSYLKDFRVYKLARLLYEHITHRIKEISSPIEGPDQSYAQGDYKQVESYLKILIVQCLEQYHQHLINLVQYKKNQQFAQAGQEIQLARQSMLQASLVCIELANRYRLQGQLQEAQNFLEQANTIAPNTTEINQEWGELYLTQGKSAHAIKSFQTALSFDPKNTDALLGLARAYHQDHNDNAFLVYAGYLQIKPKDYWGHIELARWLRENKHDDMAQGYLSRALAIAPDFDQAYVDMGQIMDDQGQYQNEEAFYMKEISLHPKSPRLYQALAEFYQKQGREDLARSYFQKSAEHDAALYYPATLVNYSLLVGRILSRHIKVVVMQYPLTDISPLKDHLGERNDLIYVENRQNFIKALGQGPYGQYFKDNFAYNFGHCTRAGNELIARHLAEVILKNE